MFGGRAFHSFIVVEKKLFPNISAECLIFTNWFTCLGSTRASSVACDIVIEWDIFKVVFLLVYYAKS